MTELLFSYVNMKMDFSIEKIEIEFEKDEI